MGNCQICQSSVPRHQSFCSHCGARQTFIPALGSARRNILSRLKDFFSETFRGETGKRFDAACRLAQFSFDEAIPDVEEVVHLETKRGFYIRSSRLELALAATLCSFSETVKYRLINKVRQVVRG